MGATMARRRIAAEKSKKKSVAVKAAVEEKKPEVKAEAKTGKKR